MNRKDILFWGGSAAFSLILGFLLTWQGVASWDQAFSLSHGSHLLARYFGEYRPLMEPILAWYAPLWPLLLEFFSATVFSFLNDRLWVYTALNLALLPFSLVWIIWLLRRSGVSLAVAIFSVSLLIAFPRFTGHALMNLKDFPAAVAYLVATIGLFNQLSRLAPLPIEDRLRWRNLLPGAAWAALPFVVRFPLVFHLLAWIFVHGVWAVRDLRQNKLGPRPLRSLSLSLVRPGFLSMLLTYAVWPNLWTATPRQWADAFRLFTQFSLSNGGTVRFFGENYPVVELPFWYPLAWLPLGLTPSGLLLVSLGILTALFGLRYRGSREPSFQVAGTPFTLMGTLFLFSLGPLISMVVRGTVVFDEERHLLFIYMPLILGAGLSLRHLSDRWLLALALLAASSGFHASLRWGLHSYIYKTPLIGERKSSEFMGDYWGACFGELIRKYPKHQPRGGNILITGAKDIAHAYAQRLSQSRFSPMPGFPSTTFFSGDSPAVGDLIIANNRTYLNERTFSRVESGEIEILESVKLPTGETACFLARRVR